MKQTKRPFLVIIRWLSEAISQPQGFFRVSKLEVADSPAELGIWILRLDSATKFKPLLGISVFLLPVEATRSVEAAVEVSRRDLDSRQVKVECDVVWVASLARSLLRLLRFVALLEPKGWGVKNVVVEGQGFSWRKQVEMYI